MRLLPQAPILNNTFGMELDRAKKIVPKFRRGLQNFKQKIQSCLEAVSTENFLQIADLSVGAVSIAADEIWVVPQAV